MAVRMAMKAQPIDKLILHILDGIYKTDSMLLQLA